MFVTGINGQLGYDVVKEALKRKHKVIGSDICIYSSINCEFVAMDITDKTKVDNVITKICPDIVIHCAAWTAVDDAEKAENIKKVYAINAEGSKNIVDACKKVDCKMIYISTDYVFDGSGNEPWRSDCYKFHPLNVYGESKLEGEFETGRKLRKFFIVRTEWVFGINGNNFVNTMLRLGKQRQKLNVVNDQIGLPTYTPDLAKLLIDMAVSDKYGYYNVTNSGSYISWYEFACEIFKQSGYDITVIPISTADYNSSAALRPLNSRLDISKIEENGFESLPDWRDALRRYLKEL